MYEPDRFVSQFWTWQYKVGGVLPILSGLAVLPAGLLWAFAPERFFAPAPSRI